MRLSPALAAAALAAAPALAAEPQPLAFTAGEDVYVVPQDGFASIAPGEQGGLELCFEPAVEAALGDFTARHRGETVEITLGKSSVFHLQVVEPYDGGCITWPLHPRIAETYRGLLTGTPGDG